MADEEFAQEGLRVHNEYRRKHGVPDLKLNRQLCVYAKHWAENLAREDRFEHRPPPRQYGENLYCLWSSNPQHNVSAKDACDSWYSEIRDYKYGQESQGILRTGHFSQMVWKNSTELGIGRARDQNGKVFIVANYNPPGNYIGQFAENVPRPRSLQ